MSDGQGYEHCKLCLREVAEVGPLQQSHVIPHFILKKSKSSGKALSFQMDELRYRLIQDDWKEAMLCGRCEHLIKRHEDFLQEVLYLRRKTKVIYKDSLRTLLAESTDRLALALLTIFWRAAVAKHDAYKGALLPSKMLEELRIIIRSGRLPARWPNALSIKVEAILVDGVTVEFLIAPFYRGPIERKQYDFVFICGGYCFTFSIPPLENRNSRGSGLVASQSNIIRIRNVSHEAIPELKKLVDEMLTQPLPDNIQDKLVHLMKKRRI